MSLSMTGSDVVAPKQARARAGGSFVSRLFWPLVFTALFAAGASLVPPRKPEPAPHKEAAVAAQAEPWIEIKKPLPLFDLSSSSFGHEPLVYTAQRNRQGGGRRDILTFGRFDGADPFLRLELYRIGHETSANGDFFVMLARTAARGDIAILRGGQTEDVNTRFGALQVGQVRSLVGSTTRACLGFSLGVASPQFRMTGIACGSPTQPLDRTALVCALDRLDLLSPGEDNDLAGFFARSELQRDTGCPAARTAENVERPDDIAIERRRRVVRHHSPRWRVARRER